MTRPRLLSRLFKEVLEGEEQPLPSKIPTGLAPLDDLLGGWKTPSFNLIGGRPGMGKTTLSLSMAYHSAKRGIPAAVISTESPTQDLLNYLITVHSQPSEETGQNIPWYSRPTEHLQTLQKELDLPLHLIGDPFRSLDAVIEDCRQCVQAGARTIFIDSLQSINYNGMVVAPNDDQWLLHQRIRPIYETLLLFLKQHEVALVVTSQLSCEMELRGGDKRPQLSDLIVARDIENLFSSILFLYRPLYYDLTEDEEGNPTQGMADLTVALNHFGRSGTCRLGFEEQNGWFSSSL